jgi:hypothetical protein
MVYFLVNNDYHVNLDEKLAVQLNGLELGLIQVPYSLKVINNSTIFKKIFVFPDQLNTSLKWMLFNFSKNKNILKKVDDDLTITSHDVLLVHTEMDMLNQYIINKFNNADAKIFLIEDGTASMCYFNMKTHKPAFKDDLRFLMLKYCYKFKNFQFKKYGVETLPVMPDSIFKGLIVKRGDSINRNIPLFKLAPFLEKINIVHENGAKFFSQPFYLFFMSEERYVEVVDHFLEASKSFSPFYFKFHPSESDNVKKLLTSLINNKYKEITIITEDDIAENLIDKYPVKYAITFNSTAVFNILEKGIVPIFLNSMLNNLIPDDSFVAFDFFLSSIKCNVPSSIEQIKPGFEAFEKEIENSNTHKLIEIIS